MEREGERHMFNPSSVCKIATSSSAMNPDSIRSIADMVNEQSKELDDHSRTV